MPVESNFDYSYVGDGNVYLIAGGGKIYTDMAARFVRSEKPVVEIIESPYDAKIVKNILESRHYSALEFDRFLIAVEGYSRVTETQLVRKRNASYMIKSGRAELNGKRLHKYVVPEKESTHTFTTELTDVNGNGVIVDINGYDLLKLSSMFYDTGLEEGYPEENLRYWKLQSTEFKAVICMNAHGLRDWFQIRCCKNAQYEIRDLANKIRRLCISVAPDLFEGSGPSCAELGYCPEGRLQNVACKGKIPLKAEVLEAWRMHKDSIKSDDLK